MSVEIEAKMKVTDLSAVRERLSAAGAKVIGAFLERNTFFDTEDRSLLAADEGLRVRSSQDRGSGAVACTMTHKGPRQHGQLKSREETEMTVGSEPDALEMLVCLGFKRVLSFEKRRESWSLGGCKVELDEVPHLGTFVEVEGPKEEAVLRVRERLGLAERPMIRASYIAMLMTFLQERGEPTRDVTFGPTA
jgi:adenylate cyclase class 2